MGIRSLFLIMASAGVLATPAIAVAQVAAPAGIDVPAVPANLEVPAGNEVYLQGRAIGTQNYICLLTKKGLRWQFLGPQATLFIAVDGELQQQITTHFLSPNPIESGLPRATWQSSFDTSQVWARATAISTDANYVAPNSVPWLLLRSVGSATGPTGGALLTPTSYIQRLNTEGGIAPAEGCSQASEIGALALVPYSTDYFFYQASQH
jgi:hypothetical protein